MSLKDFYYLELWQPLGTICANLIEGIMRNNSVKLFWICTGGSGGDVVY